VAKVEILKLSTYPTCRVRASRAVSIIVVPAYFTLHAIPFTVQTGMDYNDRCKIKNMML
jgi:hypothetical protein